MANGLKYMREIRSTRAMDELAATLAPLLRAGDVVVLNGDLGAGKTRFVQGVARALGVPAGVTSPTFTIQLVYDGGVLPLNHFDLYRLEDAEQLYDIGYWEALEGNAASFVEWGDKFPQDAPSDFLEMNLTVGEHEVRTVRVKAYGERSRRLMYLWSQDKTAHWHPIP